MDIYWYGQSCFKIKGKTATVVVDPFSPREEGAKVPKDLEAQIVLVTHNHQDHNNVSAILGEPLIISGPGEYEKNGVSIVGISSFHDKKQGEERGKNTIYHILMDGISLIHLGDLGTKLTEEQLSLIDEANILMVPVGGVYTIDGQEAAEVIAQLEPGIVIPMHYNLAGFNDNLAGLEPFLKEMGAENITPLPKLSTSKDKIPEETTVVLLTKSS